MGKTNFMEIYEKLGNLYELHEATNFYASKQFWDDAKKGKINDRAFKDAFKDELVELGLWSLIDEESYRHLDRHSMLNHPSNTGALKDRSSYSAIKTAAAEHPDSWAVKAMLKMWVLQFKDGVKSDSQIKLEKAQEETATRKAQLEKRKEQERVELEAKRTKAEMELKILTDKLPFVEDVLNKTAADYVSEKRVFIEEALQKSIKLKAEIAKLTRGIIDYKYGNSEEFYLKNLTENPISLETEIPEMHPAFPDAQIYVKIRCFLGETPNFTWGSEQARNYFRITVGDLTEEILKEKLIGVLNEINEVVTKRLTHTTINAAQKDYANVTQAITEAKNAQAAVNAGETVDPKFIAKILNIFKTGIKSAQRSADIWAGSTSDNIAVARNFELHKRVQEASIALLYCNWRAVIGEKEIAVWRTSDSIEALEDAIYEVFDNFSNELVIEVIK